MQLPLNPSLKNLRNQAKTLLKSFKNGTPEACKRVRDAHPRLSNASEDDIQKAGLTLQDAQMVLAREYGFESWPKLVEAVKTTPSESTKEETDMQDADNLISVEILDLIKVENNYHVLLKNDQNDVLWIQIGNSEGIALEYALLKQLPPRPFAHTLFLNILKWSKTDFEIHRLTIHDLKDDTFLADLTLGIQSKTVDFDCRPSDGLFLALQYDAPIFVSADVMEKVKKDPEQIYQDMNPISEEEKEIMQQKIQEHTASVPIPFDSLRGRLVGKDGRNIRAFEAATGAVLIANRITPKEVLISSSDSETLDVAVSAMKQLATRLIISPEVVQEIVQTCKSETGSNS